MGHVLINGAVREIQGTPSIKDLLAQYKIHEKSVVIELNKQILEKRFFDETLISEGDQIEIVHLVGGG